MGKYQDRDYSLDGLGKRVDHLEDTVYPVTDAIRELKDTIKKWAPVMFMGLISSGYVGGRFGAFLDFLAHHIPK